MTIKSLTIFTLTTLLFATTTLPALAVKPVKTNTNCGNGQGNGNATNCPTSTPTNSNLIKPNQLGKANCTALNVAKYLPQPPVPPIFSLEEFALKGHWLWTWKKNGRARTWVTKACTYRGNHWTAFRMDPSNGIINDDDPSNDNLAWLNKLKQPYQNYLNGTFVFLP